MKELVVIKGTSDGLVITLGAGPLEEVLAELESRLLGRASFFRGGRVALHVGERPMSVEQLLTLGKRLEQLGMTLWAVEGEHPATHVAARELGLEVTTSARPTRTSGAVDATPRDDLSGIVARRTLRSGQALHHPGHITLIGDVNDGAEVVAGGDIVIWGKLRGIAHAGAMGDDDAVVCALELMPSQIRIGAHFARPPDRGWRPKSPEKASVQDGRIVVERWKK